MQKPLTPNMELLHKSVPLIYHLMDKYGVSKKQRMGEMGQFIWEKLCTYIEAYDSKKGTLGTWAGWQIWAAKKNFLEKHYKHKNQCVPSKEIFDVTSRNTLRIDRTTSHTTRSGTRWTVYLFPPMVEYPTVRLFDCAGRKALHIVTLRNN